jgi:hypothetical protein
MQTQKSAITEDIKTLEKNSVTTQVVNERKIETPLQEKSVVSMGESKVTPLFVVSEPRLQTTQQFVQTKLSITSENKSPKQKADETLKLLLSGEKPLKADTSLTSDFSVTSAKVIAPQDTREMTRSLESLLKGEQTKAKEVKSSQSVGIESLSMQKTEPLEIKLHEAKQMIKYLSSDVKSAIDDYKSPFTRIKLQLNPQKLGEVDLTIVQRGRDLHINLSSNNAAINTLSLNAHDLKTQLSNHGINNASLNFSGNGQNDNSQAGSQQQQRHSQQQAQNEYNYFEKQESHEEILNSLEIVVANYA